MKNLPRVGITHGDINGIGYELILRTLADPELLELCTPVIFGSARVVQFVQKHLRLEPIAFSTLPNATEVMEGRVNLIDVCGAADDLKVTFGQQTEAALQAEAMSLNAALAAYQEGLIDVLVTAPGHLDNDLESHALCDFIRQALGVEGPAFDWVVGGQVRTLVLHTTAATTELGEGLAKEALLNDIRHLNAQMRSDFGLLKPRLAAIAEGAWHDGRELLEEGILAFGPFEAGAFVEAGHHRHYDAVIFVGAEAERRRVLDSLDADDTYGYVSGLPLVLTYPLLPVSYDIAGQGRAATVPFRTALYAAIDTWRHRENYRRATRRPLPKLWVARGRDDVKLDLTKDE